MIEKMNLQKLVLEWAAIAGENLLYAKDDMKADYSPFHTVCFLCQGSGEKYLKGYLISKGWKLEKIHDLVQLAKYAIKYDPNFDELFPPAEILNEYITAGRYPGDISFEAISKTDAEEAIVAAEQMKSLCCKSLQIF